MLRAAIARARRFVGTGNAGEARGAGGRRIFQNIGLQLVSRVLQIAAGLVTLPLVARALDTANFGVWTTALAYVGLFGSFTEFGLTNVATQKMASDPDREAEWLGALSSLRTLFGGAVTLLAVALIPLALHGEARVVALILTMTIVTGSAASLLAIFQSRLRAGIPFVLAMVQNVIWISTVVALSLTHADVTAFATGYAGMLCVMAGLQVVVTRRYLAAAWTDVRGRWRELMRVALPIGLGGVFVTVYYKADQLLLFNLSTSQEAGIYGAAYRFLDPLVLLPAVVMSAFFPVIAAARGSDDARLQRLVQVCLDAMAVISLPVLAGSLVLAGPVVELMFGAGYAKTATIVPILSGAFVSVCYGNLAGYLAPIIGLQWRITAYAAAGAAINVTMNVLLIPDYGAVGSAWATVVTEVLTMGLLLTTCLRALDMRPETGRLMRTIGVAALMAVAMLALRHLGLVPAALGGTAVYAGGLVATGVLRPEELRKFRTP